MIFEIDQSISPGDSKFQNAYSLIAQSFGKACCIINTVTIMRAFYRPYCQALCVGAKFKSLYQSQTDFTYWVRMKNEFQKAVIHSVFLIEPEPLEESEFSPNSK